MTIEEKQKSMELEVRTLIQNMKDLLNKSSLIRKDNPNSWVYLSALTLTKNKLIELEIELIEIVK
jgi:hypothetical protein